MFTNVEPIGQEIVLSGDGKKFKLTGYDLFPGNKGPERGVIKSNLGEFDDPAEAVLAKGQLDEPLLMITASKWTDEERKTVLDRIRKSIHEDTSNGKIIRKQLGIE